MSKQREAFEAWHNKFYGPQDKYNPIRSLAFDSCVVGLGYDDPTVQAQFVAFEGAWQASRAAALEEAHIAAFTAWTIEPEASEQANAMIINALLALKEQS